MAPNKHSFALVLDDLQQQKYEKKQRLKDENKLYSDSRATASQGQLPDDEYYLDPEPYAPVPAAQTTDQPHMGHPPHWQQPLSASTPNLLTTKQRRPANIYIPDPASSSRNEWPLHSSQPAQASAPARVSSEVHLAVPSSSTQAQTLTIPAMPSPTIESPRSFSRLEQGSERRAFYNAVDQSKSSISLAETPKVRKQSSTMSLARFLKEVPPPWADQSAVKAQAPEGPASKDLGIKRNVNISLAEFLKEVEAEDASTMKKSFELPPRPSTSGSNRSFRARKGSGASFAGNVPLMPSPSAWASQPPLSPRSFSREPRSPRPDGLSSVVDEAAPPPIPLKRRQGDASPELRRSPRELPLSPTQTTALPIDATTTSRSSPPASSKSRFLKGLNTIKSFGKNKQTVSPQNQGRDSRKDSSSVSSYRRRSHSSPPTSRPTSRVSSRTSVETSELKSRGVMREPAPRSPIAITHMQNSQDHELTAENVEPLLSTQYIAHEEPQTYTDTSTPRASTPQQLEELHIEAATEPDSDGRSGNDEVAIYDDEYDLDEGNIDTPTDTDNAADSDQHAETETLTDAPVSVHSRSAVVTHSNPSGESISSVDSSIISTTSVISAADLSAAPPGLRTQTFQPELSPDPLLTPIARRRSSTDSAAPPPIALRRRDKEQLSSMSSKRNSSLGNGFGLLRRANSKPLAKPRFSNKSPDKPVPAPRDLAQEKRERLAELELLTRSVPYEKALRGQRPFTTKSVAETYPVRRHADMSRKTYSYGSGQAPAGPKASSGMRLGEKKEKRQIGMGLREEHVMLKALEDAQWRERERRARIRADMEYVRALEEMRFGDRGARSRRGSGSGGASRGLATIEEF